MSPYRLWREGLMVRSPRVDKYEEPSGYHYTTTLVRTNQIVQHDVQNCNRYWTRLTGDIRADQDILIVLVNLGLTDTMRLNSQTKRLLYGHHIMGRTW